MNDFSLPSCHMKEAQLFSERLKETMLQHGYPSRPVVLEREFNQRYWGQSISFQTARRWLKGEAIPSQDKLQVLAEWLAVDPHWLRFGEKIHGSMQEQRARLDKKITPEEREIIERFIDLPADVKKSIGIMIKTVANHC